MTDKEIEEQCKAIRKFTKEICKDPEKCRKFLISTGIYNDKGELNEQYR